MEGAPFMTTHVLLTRLTALLGLMGLALDAPGEAQTDTFDMRVGDLGEDVGKCWAGCRSRVRVCPNEAACVCVEALV